jgi:hypothetical protein
VAAVLLATACAHQAGRQATAGAMEHLTEQSEATPPDQRPSAVVGGRVVEAAVATLSEPTQVERLSRVMETTAERAGAQAGEAVTAAMLARLGEALGAHGEGPMGDQLVALAQNTARAAGGGVLDSLAPGCNRDDPACLEQRVSELSRRAGAGFMAGIKAELGLAALALAFVIGALVMAAVLLAVRMLGRARRAPADERARAPARAPSEQPT